MLPKLLGVYVVKKITANKKNSLPKVEDTNKKPKFI